MEDTVKNQEAEAANPEKDQQTPENELTAEEFVNTNETPELGDLGVDESDVMGQLKQREEAYATLHDSYLRLMAEFDNFRKRTAREKSALLEYASEKIIQDLLPVLDDFSRSLTAMEKTDNMSSIQEGIKMVNDRMFRILEKEGLKAIDSVGQPFNKDLHEAITSVPAGEEKKGIVIDEAEKGYRLKDKVIRYAKVIVGE